MSRRKAGSRRRQMRRRSGLRTSNRATRNSARSAPAPARSPSSHRLRRALLRTDVAVCHRRPYLARADRQRRGQGRDRAGRRGASLKLAIDAGPSATPDLIRLWPQFINPDVREWCARNLHGGQLQGSMTANWTAADLDAMAHKRGLPRESLHGEFTTRDVGVDLMPGLPMMITDQGSGIIHRPRIHCFRQARDDDAVGCPARRGGRPRL